MEKFFSQFHYKKKYNIIDYFLFTILIIPTLIYLLAVKIRNYLYDKNIIKTNRVNSYIISLGNLTTGGTGKTPFCLKLVEYFYNKYKEEKIAIILRGYKGKLNKNLVNIIKSDGKIYYNAKMAGDEAYMLALNTNDNCVILTSKNKSKAIEIASLKFNCSKIILDDSFQHRRVFRNLDIVLIDSEKKLGNGFVLPLGPMREPISSIKRAHEIVLINKMNDPNRVNNYKIYLKEKYKKNISVSEMKIKDIINIDTLEPINFEIKNGFAFCAIGQPDQFYSYLSDKIIAYKSFNDHYFYKQKDLDNINDIAIAKKCNFLITTQKDAVKIKNLKSNLPIYILRLEPNIDFDYFEDMYFSKINLQSQ